MAVKVTKKKLEEALETYANLVEVYPDNEAYLQRYADMLQTIGRDTTATITLQHLHDVIVQRSEKEAAEFAQKYPQIGRISLDEVFNVQDKHTIAGKIIFELLGKVWLRLHQKKLKEGQVVYHHDSHSDSLTLVLAGSVEAYALRNDTRILIQKVGMYDVLGEQSFFQPGQVGIDAFVSAEGATIVRVPRKKLAQMVAGNKHLATMLSQRAQFRLHTYLVATHPIFKTLPLKLCAYLSRHLSRRSFEEKSMILSLGQDSDGIDMILSGETCYLASNKAGKKFMLPPLQQYSLIGNLKLQKNNTETTAELYAKTKVTTAHLPYQNLLNVSSAFPPLLERLLQHAELQQQQTIRALTKLKTSD